MRKAMLTIIVLALAANPTWAAIWDGVDPNQKVDSEWKFVALSCLAGLFFLVMLIVSGQALGRAINNYPRHGWPLRFPVAQIRTSTTGKPQPPKRKKK